MTIEQLGSITGLIASIGVLISFVYSGVQIKQNTTALQSSFTWEVMNSYNGAHDVILQNPESAYTIRKVLRCNLREFAMMY